MAHVEWLGTSPLWTFTDGNVSWQMLGAALPSACIPPTPELTACVTGAMKKALGEKLCQIMTPGSSAQTACVEYYHRLHMYQDCGKLCAAIEKPVPPSQRQAPSSSSSSSAGLVIGGLLVAAVVAAVVIGVRK